MSRPLTVQDVGEQGLLKRLQAFCPVELVGDDAAVLDVSTGRSLIVTTDVLVDRVHFSDQTTSPEDAGWRAAAANLSDLAAMGAMPLGITVGLGVPGNLAVDWVERLYQGLTDCLQQSETVIVGGDVVRSPVTTIAITAFGEADPSRIMRRSTAQPGDAIVVTGIHGASRAGLELLLHPEQGQSLNASDRALLIQAHQRPKPRLDVLPVLWRLWDGEDTGTRSRGNAESAKFKIPFGKDKTLQNSKFPTPHSPLPTPPVAGMDSSDGLADAVIQLCRASRIGARIERSQIPIPPRLTEWVSPEQAMDWALYGGEDFELVLCLPLDIARMLVDQLGAGAAMIGTITFEPEVWLVDSSGSYANQQLTFEQGFQHFG